MEVPGSDGDSVLVGMGASIVHGSTSTIAQSLGAELPGLPPGAVFAFPQMVAQQDNSAPVPWADARFQQLRAALAALASDAAVVPECGEGATLAEHLRALGLSPGLIALGESCLVGHWHLLQHRRSFGTAKQVDCIEGAGDIVAIGPFQHKFAARVLVRPFGTVVPRARDL